MRHLVLAAFATAAIAADPPAAISSPANAGSASWAEARLAERHDLIGGAAWSGQRIGANLGPFDAVGAGGRPDQQLVGGEVFVDSRSGYRIDADGPLGLILGARLAGGAWSGTEDEDFWAVAPRLAVLPGLYAQVSPTTRLELQGEVGLGLAISQYQDGPRGKDDAAIARPFPTIGVTALANFALGGGRQLGIGLGYVHHAMPYMRPSSAVFTVTWGGER